MAKPLPLPTETSPAELPSYPYFIAGVGSWFAAFGMQGVLFSWLVVGVLDLEARWVGITQSANMIPSVFLVLVGGVVADRRDRRTLLVLLHVVAAGTGAVLAGLVGAGLLSLPLLLVYAFANGTLGAFVVPARDSLLSEVTRGKDMVRAVTGMNLAQFGLQGLGALLGGAARWIGLVPALCAPPVMLLAGALAYWRLPPAPPAGGAAPRIRISDLAVGARIVLRHPVLAPTFGLTFAVGVLFGGPFMVVFPLLVRDYYGGDVTQLALLTATFPVGTIISSVAVLIMGIQHKGWAQVGALLVGSVFLGIVGIGLPFWAALLGVLAWGMAGAVFMNAGRSLFQEHAPPAERGRVLSTYSLGFMGAGGLLGAPLAGFLVEAIGILPTLRLAAGSMAVTAALLALTTGITRAR